MDSVYENTDPSWLFDEKPLETAAQSPPARVEPEQGTDGVLGGYGRTRQGSHTCAPVLQATTVSDLSAAVATQVGGRSTRADFKWLDRNGDCAEIVISPADRRFIAMARTAMPALLAEVRRLRAAIESATPL